MYCAILLANWRADDDTCSRTWSKALDWLLGADAYRVLQQTVLLLRVIMDMECDFALVLKRIHTYQRMHLVKQSIQRVIILLLVRVLIRVRRRRRHVGRGRYQVVVEGVRRCEGNNCT